MQKIKTLFSIDDKKPHYTTLFFYLFTLYCGSAIFFILDKNFSYTLALHKFFGLCMLASIVIFISLLPKKIYTFFAYALIVISTIAIIIDTFCFITFHAPLSSPMLSTAIETNLAETKSFFKLYFSTYLAFLLSLLIIYPFLFFKLIKLKFMGGGG